MTDHSNRRLFFSVICVSLCLLFGEHMVCASDLTEDGNKKPSPSVTSELIKITLKPSNLRRTNFAASRFSRVSLTEKEEIKPEKPQVKEPEQKPRKQKSSSLILKSPREIHQEVEKQQSSTTDSQPLNFTSQGNPLVKSAREGNVTDQMIVGRNFEFALDEFPKYELVARRWYTKALAAGNPAANTALGLMHFEGLGGDINKQKAFHCFEQAAEEGDVDALYYMAFCYEHGEGVIRNPKEAFKKYMLAASFGHPQAMYRLALCYQEEFGVKKDEELVITWLISAAEAGINEARENLSKRYAEGIGVPKDIPQALKYCRDAAFNDSAFSQFNLAEYYELGKGVEKDLPTARHWYGVAARNQYPGAHDAWLRCQALLQGSKKVAEKQ